MPVDIVNDTALGVAFIAGRVRKQDFHLTAIVKGAFKLVHGAPAQSLERPLPTGDEYFARDDVSGSPRYESDFAPFKPRCDVTVTGTCHQPGGVAKGRANVVVRVGPMRRSIAVFGDRHFVEKKLGGWDVSEPTPFASMPLRYEVAYGGEGFADNPVGKGFGGVDAKEGRALPNLEVSGRLLGAPTDRAPIAGLGPLNRRWGLRARKLGTYDASWLAERWPDFPLDFDGGYFNAAPPEQQVDELRGDEAIVIEGMHADVPRYESWLPSVRPRLFLRKTGLTTDPAEEVALVLDTVSIDMDTEQLVLVWRGLAPVWSRDFSEVERALVLAESLSDPLRPASDYADASTWRPAVPSVEALAADEEAKARGAVAAAAPPPPPRAESDDPQEIAEVESLRAELVSAGADAALLERLKGVTKLVVFTAILTAHAEAMAEKVPSTPAPPDAPPPPAPADVPPPKSPSEAARRERRAAEKAEVDGMRAELAAQNPDPALMARLEGVVTTAAFLAVLLDGLPEATTAEEEAERKAALDAVRAAESRAVAEDAAEEAAARAARGDRLRRDEVVAMLAAGVSLAEANLAEVDLGGLDLTRVSFAGAMLEGARLEGALLEGADFTAATLRGAQLGAADLAGAIFIGADLTDAKLERVKGARASFADAKLVGARFAGAQLEEADFSRADLTLATFAGAALAGALFDGARMSRVTFAKVVAPKATFRGADLSFANLTDARLEGAILVAAKLDHVDARQVSLADAFLEGATGTEVSFVDADLTKLRAASVAFPKGHFEGARARGARFHRADLAGASFAGALLTEADFTEASLVGSTFQLARMQQANLQKAKLGGARLVQVDLFRGFLGGADLTDADCRASNLFECELFEANTTRARFDRANVKRTLLERGVS